MALGGLGGLGAPGQTGVIGAIESLHKRSRAHPEEKHTCHSFYSLNISPQGQRQLEFQTLDIQCYHHSEK